LLGEDRSGGLDWDPVGPDASAAGAAGGKRGREVDEEFGPGDGAPPPGKKAKGRASGGETGAYEEPAWMKTADPFGGGRSYLLRELKAKFLQITSPLTAFVECYLAETGSGDESSLHDLIKVRRVFDRAEENEDWEGLLKVLYGQRGQNGSDLDTTGLADAITQMVKEDVKELERRRGGGDDEDEDEDEGDKKRAKELMDRNKDAFRRTAKTLKNGYRDMVSGKVVFLLDPILRASAQSLLNMINEKHRGTYHKPNFTLLEVMKSAAVMTTFVQLMIAKKQKVDMLGRGPAPRSRYDVAEERRRGIGGTRGSYISVYPGPTIGNMVAGSLQYEALMGYFANVERAEDGSGGLAWFSDEDIRRKSAAYGSSSGTTNDPFVYDPVKRAYVRVWKETSDADSARYPVDALLPIQTIREAVFERSLGRTDSGKAAAATNSRVVSYVTRGGKKELVSREILNDAEAMEIFYKRGAVGKYGVEVPYVKEDDEDLRAISLAVRRRRIRGEFYSAGGLQ
jgi:hypothetical protein